MRIEVKKGKLPTTSTSYFSNKEEMFRYAKNHGCGIGYQSLTAGRGILLSCFGSEIVVMPADHIVLSPGTLDERLESCVLFTEPKELLQWIMEEYK